MTILQSNLKTVNTQESNNVLSFNSLATPGETTRDNGQDGTAGGGLAVPSSKQERPYVQHRTSTNEVSSTNKGFEPKRSLQGLRIEGFSRLRNLLQPQHEFFADKYGEIKFFAHYKDGKNDVEVLYPRVKTYHRSNPYRKHQLNKQASGKTAKVIFGAIEQNDLKNVRSIDLTTTMPKAVSEFLARQDAKKARSMAWGMNKRFWQLMVEYGLVGEGHARRSNLHTWSSETPIEPHFHFHELILNVEQVDVEDVTKEPEVVDMPNYSCSKCNGTIWVKTDSGVYCKACNSHFFNKRESKPVLQVRSWSKNNKGTYVAFSPDELVLVKALWLSVVINFVRQKVIDDVWQNHRNLLLVQRRDGIKGLIDLIKQLSESHTGLIDVMVTFDKLNTELGRAKFMHKLSYNGRNPIEDYANYSNKHLDCEDPPAFIRHYDNKARVNAGWKAVCGLYSPGKDDDKQKLSPYNAEPMEYVGKTYVSEVVKDNVELVALDFLRGRPLEYYISDADKEWLLDVEYKILL